MFTTMQLHDQPNEFKPGHSLLLQLASSKVLKRTEEIIYSLESFVSEFGGALGLFLGFSFMMVWDAFAFVVYFFNSKVNIYMEYKETKRTKQLLMTYMNFEKLLYFWLNLRGLWG
jgi:hypothetical protein